MQKKTEGICFAISAEICWGSMGVAAQVLMEDSGFTVGDLVAGRLLENDAGNSGTAEDSGIYPGWLV